MIRTKAAAILLLAAGVLLGTELSRQIAVGAATGEPQLGMMAMVVRGAAAIALLAVGLVLLLIVRRPTPDKVSEPKNYRHTLRLIATVGVVLVLALVARQLAIPPTFGQYGFYRGVAVEDARDYERKHVGEDECVLCHEDKVALHDQDVHASVPCESCHGPGWRHIEDPEEMVIAPTGKEPCLTCHRRLAARPGGYPQIDWRDHYRFVGVADDSTACTACHDPHQPLFLDRDLRTARLHPLVHRCRDCHVGRMDETLTRPANHPAIFECVYCHRDVVEDFTSRAHSNIRCTACHLFFKETEYAGRIVRDADPRFCLLCHREADYRSADAAPGVLWPDHLEDVSMGPEDDEKRCIDCHRDRIHRAQEG